MGAGLKTLKRVVWPVAWPGMVFVIWYYLAHFNVVQSFLLTLLAGYVISIYGQITAKTQRSNFTPFWVRIEPNWYSICDDFGLAAGEKWKELQAQCKTPSAGYSIFRNGFNFTMLSPTLSYSNDHHTFFGDLDFKIPIEELTTEQDGHSLSLHSSTSSGRWL
jgi:hypothetical protein